MTHNPDLGWVQAGDALKPVLKRLAARRGMTTEQFRVWCATGDVTEVTVASEKSTATAGLHGRSGGKVTPAHS